MHIYHNLITFYMRTTFVISSVIVVAVLVGLFSSILPSQQTSAQMMNPKMMMNRNMMPNGTFMNPNMMFNGGWINPMFLQGQNITGSINLKSTFFNSIASQVKVSLSDAAAIAQKQVGNNSHVVSAHLDVANGFLTYTVCAIDPDMNIHRLIIDAGNGKVLSSSNFSWQNMMMFGGMMNPNMMGPMMMNPNILHLKQP